MSKFNFFPSNHKASRHYGLIFDGRLIVCLTRGIGFLYLPRPAEVTSAPHLAPISKISKTTPISTQLVLKYNVTPKFHWRLKTEAFYLKYDKWTGAYRDTSIGMEYRVWKHVALGASVHSTSLEFQEDDPEYKLEFDNSTSGVMLYAATYF